MVRFAGLREAGRKLEITQGEAMKKRSTLSLSYLQHLPCSHDYHYRGLRIMSDRRRLQFESFSARQPVPQAQGQAIR
jgi:hypothetical protein